MKKLDSLATAVVIIGALNWGLVGLFTFDLFDFFFESTWLDRFAYIFVGLSALFKIIYWLAGNWKTQFEESK